MPNPRRSAVVLMALACLAASPVAAKVKERWIGTWHSAQLVPGPDAVLSVADMQDATLRQTVRISQGGQRFRLRLSNAMGTAPLKLHHVRVARALAAGASQIDPATDRAVSFGGLSDITIPAGADYVSDPVDIALDDFADVAISLYMEQGPTQLTSHTASRTTSHLVQGQRTADADVPGAKTFTRWYFISGLDVVADAPLGAVVTLGDSITDGYGITPNSNRRFPDYLAQRLDDRYTVLNAGIGGNRLLQDGSGQSALARFDRDVLTRVGVTHLIILEGVNDLGVLTRDAPVSQAAHDRLVAEMKAAYTQLVTRAQDHGIKVFGATIPPYGGNGYYHPDASNEADRQSINGWIRTSGIFDEVIDLDAALRDPEQPDRLLPAYDSGDHLHPSEAGYKAMADAAADTLMK